MHDTREKTFLFKRNLPSRQDAAIAALRCNQCACRFWSFWSPFLGPLTGRQTAELAASPAPAGTGTSQAQTLHLHRTKFIYRWHAVQVAKLRLC